MQVSQSYYYILDWKIAPGAVTWSACVRKIGSHQHPFEKTTHTIMRFEPEAKLTEFLKPNNGREYLARAFMIQNKCHHHRIAWWLRLNCSFYLKGNVSYHTVSYSIENWMSIICVTNTHEMNKLCVWTFWKGIFVLQYFLCWRCECSCSCHFSYWICVRSTFLMNDCGSCLKFWNYSCFRLA